MDGLAVALGDALERMQRELFAAALQRRQAMTHHLDTWQEFVDLYQGEGGFSWCHWCGDDACEAQIQDETKVTIRNMPEDRPREEGKCIRCGKPSQSRVLFAQSY